MMTFESLMELVRSRRSVRRFLPEPPTREEMERLFDAARWAPSNHNRQGTRFIVLEDPAAIRELAARVRDELARRHASARGIEAEVAAEIAGHASWFAEAPRIVLALYRRPAAVALRVLEGIPSPDLVSGEPVSAAMAVENLLLAAPTVGLGACVLTAPLIAREALAAIPGGLPPGFEPAALIAVGRPAEDPPPLRRREIGKIVEFRGAP